MDIGAILRILVMLLFSGSAIVSLYAVHKRRHSYHLWGIAIWCCHVVVFTFVTQLRSFGILTISPNYLNMWSMVVRLHGGLVCLTTAIYYADKPRQGD
jgi:hypothetical protein